MPLDSVENQADVNLQSFIPINEKATKGLYGSRSIKEAAARTNCEQPIIIRIAETGMWLAKPCGSRIEKVCRSCASQCYEELTVKVLNGLLGVRPDQCAFITLTLKPSNSWKRRAQQNSILPELLKNLDNRFKRSFDSRFKCLIAIEVKGTTCHVHILFVLNRDMIPSDRAEIAFHSKRVNAYLQSNKTGRRFSFGHTSVKPVQSLEHLENLLEYPIKDSKSSLVDVSDNSDLARRMDSYIVSMRNSGRHRLPPVKRRSLQGGCGFRGRRVKVSTNWEKIFPPVSDLAISYYDYAFESDLPPRSARYTFSDGDNWTYETIVRSHEPLNEQLRGLSPP